jgi:hypothetical protein
MRNMLQFFFSRVKGLFMMVEKEESQARKDKLMALVNRPSASRRFRRTGFVRKTKWNFDKM